VLIRKSIHLTDTFKVSAEYLKIIEESAEQPNFSDYGVQLTRGFRALKLWMSLKAFGVDAFRQAISRGMAQARRAEALLRQNPHWQIITPATLGIVTFRYVRPGASESELDSLNSTIAHELILSGYAMLSPTMLGGKTVLRMCTINLRTLDEDLAGTFRRLEDIAGAAM
jgi:aromatic-L-amino-acid/L-tryptophan decarboxylase